MCIAASRLAAAFTRLLCRQKNFVPPTSSLFLGGVVLATALSIVFLRWHLHYMLFAFVHEAIVKRFGLMTVSILDGRSVPFDAPGPRSGGETCRSLHVSSSFLFLTASDLHFPPENKRRLTECVTASIPFDSIHYENALYICILHI